MSKRPVPKFGVFSFPVLRDHRLADAFLLARNLRMDRPVALLGRFCGGMVSIGAGIHKPARTIAGRGDHLSNFDGSLSHGRGMGDWRL